jgi:GNAT superfamily N-acetyltransferase
MSFKIRKGKRKDCKAVLDLIRELAIYEKAADEVEITAEQLAEDGFGKQAAYEIFVAESEGKIIGTALFYTKYSTWKGKSIYLEDLIVREEFRGVGAGKALFEAVMQVARERQSGRMEWQVLDWNEPAIGFYRKYGAELDGEWINGKFRREQLQKMDLS